MPPISERRFQTQAVSPLLRDGRRVRKQLMHLMRLGVIVLGVALAGCATSNLPRGARLVGGGLMIEYSAPVDGTAILIERTSGRVVATESLSEGNTFNFHPNRQGYDEILYRLFGDTNAMGGSGAVVLPTNAVFQLYFVPAK